MSNKERWNEVSLEGRARIGEKLNPPLSGLDRAVVRTCDGKSASFVDVSWRTRVIYFQGPPFLWAFEKALLSAPNLKKIELLSTQVGKLGDSHRQLCAARGVEIVEGHHVPSMEWSDRKYSRSPHYRKQQEFMKNLEGVKKEQFEKLRSLKVEDVLMTSRYFCLQGEEYISQRNLCRHFGLSEQMHHLVSQKVNAVLYYLGYGSGSFKPAKDTLRRAAALESKVPRLNARFEEMEKEKKAKDDFESAHGETMPECIPTPRIEVLGKILEAKRSGKLEELKNKSLIDWKTLLLRFGFDESGESSGIYRSLEEVGALLGVTKQCISLREKKAFEFLNISPPKERARTKIKRIPLNEQPR